MLLTKLIRKFSFLYAMTLYVTSRVVTLVHVNSIIKVLWFHVCYLYHIDSILSKSVKSVQST